jgi:arylsulfatase A
VIVLPNIVYILADDLGFGDLSCLNPDSRIPTPHMDAAAAQGMTFTDAHSNSAVCTPTRYGVLTGRYCWRGRLKSGVLMGYDEPLIEPDRLTVASLLRSRGYQTACIGKWHLGLGWSWRDAAQKQVDYDRPLSAGPHTVGFDYSCILPASLDMPPYCYVEDGRVVEPPTRQVTDSPRPAFWRGGEAAAGFDHSTCLLEFTCRAEAFIAAQARSDQPFFLYFATPSPHTPHVPREPFRGRSRAGSYGDFVVEHDWSVGRVLAAIDRAGLADRTLVIITSDNGAHVRGGGFDLQRETGHASSHIYRGQKSDAWDGGHRVPFIARWPGTVPAGTQCDRLTCLTDLMATAADVAAAELPTDAGEDSTSILPLLRDPKAPPVRASVIHHSISGKFAIRHGRWKLVLCTGSGGWSQPDADPAADAPAMQLYDMHADPSEQTNMIGRFPEISRELHAMLQRTIDDGRSAERR